MIKRPSLTQQIDSPQLHNWQHLYPRCVAIPQVQELIHPIVAGVTNTLNPVVLRAGALSTKT